MTTIDVSQKAELVAVGFDSDAQIYFEFECSATQVATLDVDHIALRSECFSCVGVFTFFRDATGICSPNKCPEGSYLFIQKLSCASECHFSCKAECHTQRVYVSSIVLVFA